MWSSTIYAKRKGLAIISQPLDIIIGIPTGVGPLMKGVIG